MFNATRFQCFIFTISIVFLTTIGLAQELEHEAIPSEGKLPTATEIISKYYEVIGGEMALHGIETMSFEAKFIAHGASREDGTVALKWARNGWHYDFKTNSDTTYVKTTDGKQFLSVSQSPRELTGQSFIKMEEILPVPMQSLRWLDYENLEEAIQVKGLVRFRDEACYHVEFKPKDGNPIQRYFSKESGLLIKLEYISESTNAAWVLSDYQQIEEVLIPMHRENYFSGILEYEVVKEEVKIGEEIDEKWFKPPVMEDEEEMDRPFDPFGGGGI